MNPLQIPLWLIDAARAVPPMLERLDRIVDGLDRLEVRIEALREDIRPIHQLAEVRRGIEPLDEDMRMVRESIDELEPLVKRIDAQLADMRGDLAPLGDLADKIPGVGS